MRFVLLSGVTVKTARVRLCHSRMLFVQATDYPEPQQCYQESLLSQGFLPTAPKESLRRLPK